MTNREFHFWIMGHNELCGRETDMRGLWVIRNHLNLVQAVEGYLDSINQILYEGLAASLEAGEAKGELSFMDRAYREIQMLYLYR